jgi:16S rRNA (guanine1207-N2)-methyltransferase
MGHYFTNEKNLKNEIQKIEVIIKDNHYVFKTNSGVFSKKGLDFGTRTLLENLDVDLISGDVLDFGCGYGPIGIYIKKNTKASVDMIDINNRSLELAKENAKLNEVEVNVFQSDIYSNIHKKYDYIISNPPIRVGKEKLYLILFGAKNHLKNDGELWIVVNKDQGAKSLVRDLEGEYNVSVIDKNKGFYVIKAQNR